MTHEYTVATGGVILGAAGEPPPTAVAWAGATILAVGSDAEVRAISRGDSTFVDLAGRAVSAGGDATEATAAMRGAVADGRVAAALARLDRIEVGSQANLLIWSADPRWLAPRAATELTLVGSVRNGLLTWNDAHPDP